MRHRLAYLFGMLLASAVLLAGCGVGGSKPLMTATRTAPATPATPVTTLAWQQVALPAGIDLSNGSIAVSPANGRDLWLCALTAGGHATIWASQDMAATWQRIAAFSPATAETARWCALVASTHDPHTLAAVFSWGAGADGTLRSMSYLSSDGGIHWQRLAGEVQTMEVDTSGGTTYAILNDTSNFLQEHAELVVSTDGLRSWRVIRLAGLAANDSIVSFWLNPTSDDVFTATYRNTLWHSQDSGVSWSRVSTPSTQTELGAWLPQQHRWLFCGWDTQVRCSTDLGKTWIPQPKFGSTFSCAKCGENGTPTSNTNPCYPNAIAADGALIAACPFDSDGPSDAVLTVYRLMPGATQWSNLGPAPAPLSAVAATGQIWSFGSMQGTISVAMLPVD